MTIKKKDDDDHQMTMIKLRCFCMKIRLNMLIMITHRFLVKLNSDTFNVKKNVVSFLLKN